MCISDRCYLIQRPEICFLLSKDRLDNSEIRFCHGRNIWKVLTLFAIWIYSILALFYSKIINGISLLIEFSIHKLQVCHIQTNQNASYLLWLYWFSFKNNQQRTELSLERSNSCPVPFSFSVSAMFSTFIFLRDKKKTECTRDIGLVWLRSITKHDACARRGMANGGGGALMYVSSSQSLSGVWGNTPSTIKVRLNFSHFLSCIMGHMNLCDFWGIVENDKMG